MNIPDLMTNFTMNYLACGHSCISTLLKTMKRCAGKACGIIAIYGKGIEQSGIRNGRKKMYCMCKTYSTMREILYPKKN
jgi:predicted double-glycine peptidase